MNIGLMDCIEASRGLRGVGRWCTATAGAESGCYPMQVPTNERPDIPTQGLRALGAYPTAYPAVRKFQGIYNGLQAAIDEATPYARYNPIRVDGVCGENTTYALWGYAEYQERETGCVSESGLGTDVRNGGPRVAKACLMADGMTEAEVEEFQRAWQEYRTYERSGGAPVIVESDEEPVVEQVGTTGKKKESSIWPWILGGGALVVLGIILLKKKR